MAKPLSVTAVIAVVVAAVLLAPVVLAAETSAPGPGPCCPAVKGQHAPVAHKTPAGTTELVGPRFVCQAPRPLNLVFQGETHQVGSIEAAGSVLVPAHAFALLGGTVAPQGDRGLTIALGPRQLALTLGSPSVQVTDGTATRQATWPLCPRRLDGVPWVPLRSAAEALGLRVEWRIGTIVLSPTGRQGKVSLREHKVAPAAGKCPADRVEEALGIKVLRSPADTPVGSGTQVLELFATTPLTVFGVQPGDIILVWNDERIKCPKDLDDQLAREKAASQTVKRLIVMRGTEKLTLLAK